MSDEAEEIWTSGISDGILLRQYDDGDIVIYGSHQHDWDGVLLKPNQIRKFIDLVSADNPTIPEPVSLGEGHPGEEARLVSTEDGFTIRTDWQEVSLTYKQAQEFCKRVSSLSPPSLLP